MMDRRPKVTLNRFSDWHLKNELHITVHTLHNGFTRGRMYSIEHARYLAGELNAAADKAERKLAIIKASVPFTERIKGWFV